MSLIDQIFMAVIAIYFCISIVACVVLYEIRSGKVSPEELNKSEAEIQEIKDLDWSFYIIIFLFWGLAIFAPKGE